MPKIGMEPLRRRALIDATISAIGERGSLDVTMSEIAGRAGVSSALAHHYFGAKDELLFATMRHILAELAIDMRRALQSARSPRERVSAVVAVNFSDIQFQAQTIAAWLAFYVEAQQSSALRRLLRVYARRLHSNLMSGLTGILARHEADRAAEATAAMIDGLYIRQSLKSAPIGIEASIALTEDYLNALLATASPSSRGEKGRPHRTTQGQMTCRAFRSAGARPQVPWLTAIRECRSQLGWPGSVRLDAVGIDIVALFADGEAHRLQPLLLWILRTVSKRHDLIAGLGDTFDEAGAFRLARIAELDQPDAVIGGGDVKGRMRPAHGDLLDGAGKLDLIRLCPGPAVMGHCAGGESHRKHGKEEA